MKRKLIVFTVFSILAASVAAQPGNMKTPEGLWVAHHRYGPDVRGTLLILQKGAELQADIAGFSSPVRVDGDKLTFELPDGKGSFRGERSGSNIAGQWIQQHAISSGARYSTPVTLRPDGLRPDGQQRWRGEVEPLDDRMTYYLPVTRAAGGHLSTYLRNPERNQGRFFPVTRMEADGGALRLIGKRRGANEEAVILSGNLDADRELLKITINGRSFDFERDTDSSSPFYPRSRNSERYSYSPPAQLDDGWPVSTLEKEGIDRAVIERFVQFLIDLPMDNLGSHQVHSVLIARRGKLVLEEYFHGHHRDMPHDTRSAAKSWTNVLIGAAIQAGVPLRLDTPVYQTMLGSVPADLDPRKKAMTLEHLISMTAGFDCDDSGDRPGDEDPMQDQTEEPNWYRYTLNVPMAWSSGEQIVYCSIKPNLAAGMLQRVAGEPLPEMFHRLVAKPMTMGRYHLFLQPTGEPYGGGGHHFTTRDFMKLTQLFMNDGNWDGRQIVSRDWARKSSAPLRNLSLTQTYGYLWNSVAYDYKGRKLHAYFPGGNGGQVYIGIPELDLLIAFTGGNYSDPALFTAQRIYVPQHILPAVN